MAQTIFDFLVSPTFVIFRIETNTCELINIVVLLKLTANIYYTDVKPQTAIHELTRQSYS